MNRYKVQNKEVHTSTEETENVTARQFQRPRIGTSPSSVTRQKPIVTSPQYVNPTSRPGLRRHGPGIGLAKFSIDAIQKTTLSDRGVSTGLVHKSAVLGHVLANQGF